MSPTAGDMGHPAVSLVPPVDSSRKASFECDRSVKGASLFHDLLLFMVIPPLGAFAWLLLSRGWTNALGTSDSEVVKGWTNSGFWKVLIALYAVCLAMLVYNYFLM